MGRLTVTNEINCDAETFWKTFFDKDFQTRLHLEGFGYKKFTVDVPTEDEASIKTKTHGEPNTLQLPAPVAKILGNNLSLTEEGEFDKEAPVWRWKSIPSTYADKLRLEGTLRVESAGEGKVRWTAVLTIEAKFFGIGGLIESSFEKSLRGDWSEFGDFMSKRLASSA